MVNGEADQSHRAVAPGGVGKHVDRRHSRGGGIGLSEPRVAVACLCHAVKTCAVVEGKMKCHRTVAAIAVDCILSYGVIIAVDKGVAYPQEGVARCGEGVAVGGWIDDEAQGAEAVAAE